MDGIVCGESKLVAGRGMKDNRHHPRLSIAVDVDVRSGSNFYAGRTRDLSVGGLFVETEVALPIGMQIEVELALPKGSFTLPCEVVWLLSDRSKQTVGLGVRFLDLPPPAKRAIETFMTVRSPVDFEAPELDESPPASGPPPLPRAETAPSQKARPANRSIPTPRAAPAPAKPLPPRPSTRNK